MTIATLMLAGTLFVGAHGGDGTDIWDYEPAPVGYTQAETVEAPIEEAVPDRTGCLTVYDIDLEAGAGEFKYLTRGDTGHTIRVSIVGNYLWVQFRDDGTYDSQGDDIVSIPLEAGQTEAVVCR